MRTAILAGLTAALLAAPAFAAEHRVEMLNKDPETGDRNVFEPAVLMIAPGDTVIFVPTDKGHNSVASEGMIPEGGTAWEGGINEEVSVTFDVEGTYGYNCVPHYGQGMVGLILVGDASANLEEAKAVQQRGRAKAVYEELFAEAEAMLAN